MRSFTALLVFFVALPVHAQLQPQPERQPLLPTRLGLEAKWDSFKKNPVSTFSLAAILKEDPDGGQVIPWSDSRYFSIWAAAQRLTAEDPKLVAELREAEDRIAQSLTEQASGKLERLMPLHRRYPWSASVHEALLEGAHRELIRGNHGLAARTFRDVFERAEDSKLRARAQVGVWLATAHDAESGVLDAAFAGVDPKATYFFLGKQFSAAEIRKRLETKMDKASEVVAPKVEILIAPGGAWVHDRPISHSNGNAVAGPTMVAWFDDNDTKPRWIQTPSPANGKGAGGSSALGQFSPAVDTSRLYTRWGMQSVAKKFGSSNLSASVAALDLRTGALVWSTASNADWDDLAPVNDPVVSAGRLYVLALSRTQDYAPIYLFCMNAGDGQTLWKREIVQNNTSLPGINRVDVAHFGNRVTVAGGSVYCSTNMGVVACIDARDGMIEWLRTYPQDKGPAKVRPAGASPFIAGTRVVFCPRDASTQFALDSRTGELSWSNSDGDTPIGVWHDTLIVAGSRRVAGLNAATGKQAWERQFEAAIDSRAIFAGAAIYVGTPKKLYRLESAKGTERDWEMAIPDSGLSLRDGTLFGVKRGPELAASELPSAVFTEKPARIVHRIPGVLVLDGHPDEWEKFKTTTFSADGGIKGKVVVTHDGQNLYLGITATGADFRGSRLEIGLTPISPPRSTTTTPMRWTIAPDAVPARWVGAKIPDGVKAIAHHNIVDRSATYELTIPLKHFLPNSSLNVRQGLELTLLPENGRPPALARVVELLYVQRLSEQQDASRTLLATAFAELENSWLLLEEQARARNPRLGSSAEFLRDFIKTQPSSPAVPHALVRLDQLLRKDVDDNPSGELLEFADKAGVPAPVRTWYKQLAGNYLSQWVYPDGNFTPQAIELELFSGESATRRIFCKKAEAEERKPLFGIPKTQVIDGKKRMWIDDIEVDPRTRIPLAESTGPEGIGKRILPLPPDGAWRELRVPLLWFGVHDLPIQGISFKQMGGSNIFWDRTSIFINGKESILLEDGPADGLPAGVWRWKDAPIKVGKKSHTTPHPNFKNEEARHSITFRKAFHAHLLPAPVDAPAREKLVFEHLPGINPDGLAAAILAQADRLWESEPAKRKKIRVEILKKAEADEIVPWLDHFLAIEIQRGNPKVAETIDELVTESKLQEKAASLRDRSQREFLRNWQVVGPFPSLDENEARQVESGIDFDAVYDVPAGKLRWNLHESPSPRIDVTRWLAGKKSGVVYAGCWVHSEFKQQVLLRTISDDRLQLWMNPKTTNEPSISEPYFRTLNSGTNSAIVDLREGWNEILVRLDTFTGRAAFSLEVREKDDTGPLKSVRVTAQMKDLNK